MIHALGVDITYLAGSVDWTRMRAAGVTFAFVKASDGDGSINPRFNEYWRGAEDAGVLRGAYYRILRFPINPQLHPDEQASWLNQLAPPGELPPAVALHVEDPARILGGTEESARSWNVPSELSSVLGERDSITPAEAFDWLQAVLKDLEGHTGKRPLVRTDYNGWMHLIRGGINLGQDGIAWVRDYPLWVVSDFTRVPLVPPPWAPLRWAFWQFSTHGRGAKYGVQSQYINLNLYNGGVSLLKDGACWMRK